MTRFKKASEIQIGVVGYGGAFDMGRQHLEEMREAGMTPIAVCELDPERLGVAEAEFPGIETYTRLATMLKKSEVNLVTLITPHNTHARLALQCLKAGRHVVCEKPMAIRTSDCDAMIAQARRRRLLLSTYHNRHWDGCIMRAVKQIKSGAIGKVVRVEAHMGARQAPGDSWRSSKSISGGILYDWGVHLLEYTLQIIRSEIVEVSGFSHSGFWARKSAWKKDTIEDEAFATIRFANGAWATLCMTSLDSNAKDGQLEITGTKGTYIFDYRRWRVVKQDGDVTVTERGANPKGEQWRYYKNIAAHLARGSNLIITPEWSRRPIHIIDLACQSARKGTALKPKYK